MDPNVYQFLKKQPELLHFVRMNPGWYRQLSRNPASLQQLEKDAKVYYGRTIPQRIEKLNSQIQMVHMLIQMAGVMRD